MKSDNVKKGMQQAPHRSLFNALGFTEEEMNKPMVGIVSSYNEIVPGHMNLDKIPRNVWRLHISLMRSSWFRTAIRMSRDF